jgi:hypothetical protein
MNNIRVLVVVVSSLHLCLTVLTNQKSFFFNLPPSRFTHVYIILKLFTPMKI